MQEEERKVRAHLALHQCYGVDLNQTAVELAEVSLWLNVMHPGLRGPWFGLHLRRGNSLIGARRCRLQGCSHEVVQRATAEDRPLSAGPIGDGEVHHFLLPAHGWGAVGSDKRAKELAAFEAERLRDWATVRLRRRPSACRSSGCKRWRGRVERVWELAQRRLEIAEQEVARHIDVWGAERDLASGHREARYTREADRVEPERPRLDVPATPARDGRLVRAVVLAESASALSCPLAWTSGSRHWRTSLACRRRLPRQPGAEEAAGGPSRSAYSAASPHLAELADMIKTSELCTP